MMRTSWSFVAESREGVSNTQGGILWFSLYQPSAGAYVPLMSSATEVPAMYTKGSLFSYSPDSTWWKFCAVGNYIQLAWNKMNPVVVEKQNELEGGFAEAVKKITEEVKDMDDEKAVEKLTQFSKSAGQAVFDAWGTLLTDLIGTFHDGYHMDPSDKDIKMNEFFYPRWWLVLTDYFTHTLYDNDWVAPEEAWETVDNLWGAEDFRAISDERVKMAEDKMGLSVQKVLRDKNVSAGLLLGGGMLAGFLAGWVLGKLNEKGKHVYQALP
jgi:hypothetical protein